MDKVSKEFIEEMLSLLTDNSKGENVHARILLINPDDNANAIAFFLGICSEYVRHAANHQMVPIEIIIDMARSVIYNNRELRFNK